MSDQVPQLSVEPVTSNARTYYEARKNELLSESEKLSKRLEAKEKRIAAEAKLKIAAYKSKIRAIKKELKRLEEAEEEEKQRILGKALVLDAQKNKNTAKYLNVLIGALENDQERALFGLEPKKSLEFSEIQF